MGIDHGTASAAMICWLGLYESETPGLGASAHGTTILGERSEVHPDVSLRIDQEFGGQSRIVDDFVRGAPELLVEVAHSSRYVDLGPKFTDYDRAGVLEYVVRAFDPDELIWFKRVDGVLTRVSPDNDGLYRSTVFPGLWLDPAALLAGDLRRLKQVVDQGIATPEHAAFVARLAENQRTAK